MVVSSKQPETRYEQPQLFVIGSVLELTQQVNPKDGSSFDGASFVARNSAFPPTGPPD